MAQKSDTKSPLRRYICSATKSGWPIAPVIESVAAKQANKALYLFLSRDLVLTAITTKTFKSMVKGDTSRLMTVIDKSAESEADVSLVRKAGRHPGMESPEAKLQLCKCDSSFDKFIFSCQSVRLIFKSIVAYRQFPKWQKEVSTG